MSVTSIAVPSFCTSHHAGEKNIINSCCYQSSPLSSGYEHTQVYRQARTYGNKHMTEWLAADIHRWGVEEKNIRFFTSLLNKAALSVRLISNMFRFGAFFSFCPFIFRFSSVLFCSPLFSLSLYGWESVTGTQKTKKKIKSIEKRGG